MENDSTLALSPQSGAAGLALPGVASTPAAIPATPSGVTPAAQPTTANPPTLWIGGREVPTSLVESQLLTAEAAKQRYEEALTTLGDAKAMHEIITALSPDEQAFMMDALDDVRAARSSGTPITDLAPGSDEFNPPSDYRPQPQEDMTHGELTVLQRVINLEAWTRHQLRNVSGVAQQALGAVQPVVQANMDAAVVDQAHRLGYTAVTLESVREMRANGIADPLKVLQAYGAPTSAPVQPPAGTPGAPPQGAPPSGSQVKTFDSNDPKIKNDLNELMRLAREGYVPADERDRAEFEKQFGTA